MAPDSTAIVCRVGRALESSAQTSQGCSKQTRQECQVWGSAPYGL